MFIIFCKENRTIQAEVLLFNISEKDIESCQFFYKSK